MVVVYSLLQKGHPGAQCCEQFLAAHSGWFTSPLVLFEAKNVLTKVYNVDPRTTTQKLTQFAAGPVAVLSLDATGAALALQIADTYDLDLTDAVLLHLTTQCGAGLLATDDLKLTQACAQLGVTTQSPLDTVLRQQIAAWESTNLSLKGLPRVLRRIHHWLCPVHPQAAKDFWSATSGGSHLP